MPDYAFYRARYKGASIPREDFGFMSGRAADELLSYERVYTVSGTDEARKMAICAMADVLYYYDTAANGGMVTSASVGSVSASTAKPDVSNKAQSKELYRAAQRYLDIYRGCPSC